MGVALLDPKGVPIFMNDAMRPFFAPAVAQTESGSGSRWRAWDDHGRPVPHEDLPTERALRGERVVPGIDLLLTNADRSEVWKRLAAVPLTDRRGRIAGVIATLIDIDELKALNDDLDRRVRARTSEMHELFRRVISAQEEERWRLSRDIHDQLGQGMTALRMHLQALKMFADGHDAVRELAGRTQQLAEEIDQSIDFLTWDLKPAALEIGLSASLGGLIDSWSRRFGIAAEVHTPHPDLRLSRDAESNLYRLVQEALHNVVKHARATRVRVGFERRLQEAVLTIEDNGRGFEVAGSQRRLDTGGVGLASMRERAALAGGRFEIQSTPGSGTSVRVRVRLRPDTD